MTGWNVLPLHTPKVRKPTNWANVMLLVGVVWVVVALFPPLRVVGVLACWAWVALFCVAFLWPLAKPVIDEVRDA